MFRVTVDNDEPHLFPSWIYKQERPLYVLREHDISFNKPIRSPVTFTPDEVAAINKTLNTHQQIASIYITNNFIHRLHVFNEYFNCPIIESVTAEDPTMWAVENDCLDLFKRLPNYKTKYYNAAIKSGSSNIIEWFNDHHELYSYNTTSGNHHFEIIKWLYDVNDEEAKFMEYGNHF